MLTRVNPQKITRAHLKSAKIPQKHWQDHIFSLSYTESASVCASQAWKYIKNIKKLSNEGIGIYIVSDKTRTGKTTLACTVLRAALSYAGHCRYLKFHELISIMKQKRFGKASQTDICDLYNSTFLCIDNCDIATEEQENLLDQVMQARSDEKKSTIIIPQKNRISMFGTATLDIIKNEMIKIEMHEQIKSKVDSILEELC